MISKKCNRSKRRPWLIHNKISKQMHSFKVKDIEVFINNKINSTLVHSEKHRPTYGTRFCPCEHTWRAVFEQNVLFYLFSTTKKSSASAMLSVQVLIFVNISKETKQQHKEIENISLTNYYTVPQRKYYNGF